MAKEKITCSKCIIIKDVCLENFYYSKSKNLWSTICKECSRKWRREYNKIYYQNNKEKERERVRNKPKELNNKYQRNSKKNPVKKLRSNISRSILYYLKLQNSNKNKKSHIKYLNYSYNELKNHLELQFESWMSWHNYGRYDSKSWDDNEPLTWTWQIDHIIPQSKLPYFSMEDDNFKKCWALENLRPYSAKQNNLDRDRKPKSQDD